MNTLISDLTTTLPPGFPRPCSVCYHDNQLFMGGRTAPAWLASLRTSDLGNFRHIQFPSENNPNSNQAKFNVVLKMQWYKNELLVLFSGSSQLTIAAVDVVNDPDILVWREIISTTRGNDILSFWNDGNTIYASGYGQDVTIGSGVISYFVPPEQTLKEWLVPLVASQYAPLLGVGESLYYVNGNMNDGGNFRVAKFGLLEPHGVEIIDTQGIRMQSLGPDMVDFKEHLYLSFFPTFFGNDFGVPPDMLFRVNKTTLLVEEFFVTGTSKGAVWDFWSDGSVLWILRTGTLSRYDGETFTHFDLGPDRPELIVGDNDGHLFGIERGTAVIVRRYPIHSNKPTPALIIGSDETSLTLGDGLGGAWRVPATKL